MMRQLLPLIRIPNLLMLAGIQFLLFFRLCDYRSSVMTVTDLIFLIIITMLIGAGGYVINDYYDIETDKINKPTKWIAGNSMSTKGVLRFYCVIVVLGFLLSIWLAVRLDLLRFIFIYPVAVTCLWFYSFALKCKPVVGNLWVAIFCAGVVGIVFLPDVLFDNERVIKDAFLYYLLFAFLTTWFREIVKDIEDYVGDAVAGCKTFPVAAGMRAAKWMSIILGLLLLAALMVWDIRMSHRWINLILTVIQGFTVAAMAMVWWGKNKQYYHHASTIIKVLMMGGTLVLLFV